MTMEPSTGLVVPGITLGFACPPPARIRLLEYVATSSSYLLRVSRGGPERVNVNSVSVHCCDAEVRCVELDFRHAPDGRHADPDLPSEISQFFEPAEFL